MKYTLDGTPYSLLDNVTAGYSLADVLVTNGSEEVDCRSTSPPS